MGTVQKKTLPHKAEQLQSTQTFECYPECTSFQSTPFTIHPSVTG